MKMHDRSGRPPFLLAASTGDRNSSARDSPAKPALPKRRNSRPCIPWQSRPIIVPRLITPVGFLACRCEAPGLDECTRIPGKASWYVTTGAILADKLTALFRQRHNRRIDARNDQVQSAQQNGCGGAG